MNTKGVIEMLTDKNDNGDYVISSTVSGMGCKQTGDILHNYTVAKVTQDVNSSKIQ